MNCNKHEERELFSTLPQTEAEAAVLRRSKQLTDFRWTPIRDVPTYFRGEKTFLPAGVEVLGFPYSSTEKTDKFFTENVSFETFLTAIPNPYSKLYQPGRAALDACNYGIVCNGLARYALGIRRRVSTARCLTIPGMELIAERGTYRVEDLRLCDVLWVCEGKKEGEQRRNHVAMITDLLKTADGEIVRVEVSESVRPSCKRASYDVDVFYEKYQKFSLCRYAYLHDVPPLNEADDALLRESGLDKISPKIAVDNGNKSNYLQGQTVLLSAFPDESDAVLLYRNGELVERVTISARGGVFCREPERGYYRAVLEKNGEEVEFCVNAAKVSHTVCDGILTVTAHPCDENSKILYADFRQKGEGSAALEKYEELTDEEKRTGTYSRPIPEKAKHFKVYYENKYGVWTHPMTNIFS